VGCGHGQRYCDPAIEKTDGIYLNNQLFNAGGQWLECLWGISFY